MNPLALPALTLGALLLLAVPARAADVVVRFEATQPTVWGESAYVLGDLPALGGGDRARALRMRPSAAGSHRWELDVALPAGATYRWVVLVRDNAPGAQGDARNARVVSGVRQETAPGKVEERRVRVRYLSGFAAPRVSYERAAGSWAEAAFRRAGAGRGPGESLWEVELRTALATLALVPHDGAGRTDLAPDGGPYRTTRADLVIASGEVLPDLPPARRTDADGRGRVVHVRDWYSQTLGNARDLFIYLPRDYDASTRRYPVVYAHDGQNLFDPRAIGGGWHAGETLDREIAAGRVDDLILVGVANTRDRMAEYMPPEEGGTADRYGRFLTDELKPWVDANLRTLTGRDDTGVLGSSLGGLVSFYLGWERPDVFGRVGSLSGSFWLRGHLDAIALDAPRDLRVWLDSGTAGKSGDSYEDTVAARDLLLGKGAALGGRLAHEVDVGAGHNEAAWRGRLGRALGFLFPAR
jgi:predicted alpha/beta superfamily hydrolase